MAGDPQDEERPLRSRLRVLAERSALPVPALDVVDDPEGRLLPATVRDGGDGEDHVAVSSSLLRASPDAQTWYLATALGHWASPVPRRRRREGWVATGLLVTLCVGFGLAELDGVVDLPGAATVAANAALPDPSWWARLHTREPTPSARVAAAERRGGPDVAPPLY
jgi:hypothetical protein